MSRIIDPNSVRQQAIQFGLPLYIYKKYLAGIPVRAKTAWLLSERLGVPLAAINTKTKKSPGTSRYTDTEHEYARRWNKKHSLVPDWSEQLHIMLGH